MEHVILKFRLNLFRTMFDLPSKSKILDFQEQDGHPTMWVLCPKNFEEIGKYTRRAFFLAATGEPFSLRETDEFRATLQLAGGRVIHIFEETA